jgi:FtsP/CotA-like multicopper oxidase with cupredoxin domain
LVTTIMRAGNRPARSLKIRQAFIVGGSGERGRKEGPMSSNAVGTEKTVHVRLEAAETEWEIAPGRVVPGYGFNGQVPGPAIEADVGDTLVVELTNALPEPTSIHWHGLRVPAEMDGTQLVQQPIPPGQTFRYRFVLPDAGTFWYHPHVNETVQLEKGLYGTLIVRGHDEPHLDGERVLVLDDLKLDRKGNLARFGGFKERHEGRRGDTRLMNGKAEPELEIAAGQVERWRIVNASSSRYVLLSIGSRPFIILGTDGGLIPEPVTAAQVLLAPADRVELAVGPFAEGQTLGLESLPYARGMVKEHGGRYATVRVGSPAPSRAQIPKTLRAIERSSPETSRRTGPCSSRPGRACATASTGWSKARPITTPTPSASGTCRSGTSSTRPRWITRSISMASSSRSSK